MIHARNHEHFMRGGSDAFRHALERIRACFQHFAILFPDHREYGLDIPLRLGDQKILKGLAGPRIIPARLGTGDGKDHQGRE